MLFLLPNNYCQVTYNVAVSRQVLVAMFSIKQNKINSIYTVRHKNCTFYFGNNLNNSPITKAFSRLIKLRTGHWKKVSFTTQLI